MVTKVIRAASATPQMRVMGLVQNADNQMGVGGKAPAAVAGAQENRAIQMDGSADPEQCGQRQGVNGGNGQAFCPSDTKEVSRHERCANGMWRNASHSAVAWQGGWRLFRRYFFAQPPLRAL